MDDLTERIKETLVAIRDIAPDALSDEKVDTTAAWVAKGVRDLRPFVDLASNRQGF